MINDGSSIKVNSGKGNSFRSSKTSPSGKPKKDFQKVFSKEKREDQQEDAKQSVSKQDTPVKEKEGFDEITEKIHAENKATKAKGPSLFDLVGAKEVDESESLVEVDKQPAAELTAEIREESLSALFKDYGKKEKLKSIQSDIETASISGTPLPKDNTERVSQVPTPSIRPAALNEQDRFSEEQIDLSTVNPFLATQDANPTQQIQPVQEPKSLVKPDLQQIIDQIISKLYTIEKSGKTDTLIKLKHPPLFAGSGIVVTSFDTAKKEFNITFENLTAAAKQILDLRENQDALKLALEQKGYTVHIITATTLSETVDLVSGKPIGRGGKEAGDQASKGDDEREEHQEE